MVGRTHACLPLRVREYLGDGDIRRKEAQRGSHRKGGGYRLGSSGRKLGEADQSLGRRVEGGGHEHPLGNALGGYNLAENMLMGLMADMDLHGGGGPGIRGRRGGFEFGVECSLSCARAAAETGFQEQVECAGDSEGCDHGALRGEFC